MAKTLLPGWHMDPGNRNRMIGPQGERVSYYKYRNEAAKQEGYKSYHSKREAVKAVKNEFEKMEKRGDLKKTPTGTSGGAPPGGGGSSGSAGPAPSQTPTNEDLQRLKDQMKQAHREIDKKGYLPEKTKSELKNHLQKLKRLGLIDDPDGVFYEFMRVAYRKGKR